MSEKADISRPTIYAHIEDLERRGLIVQTRTLGQSRLFKVNTDDPVVQAVLTKDMEASGDAGEPNSLP